MSGLWPSRADDRETPCFQMRVPGQSSGRGRAVPIAEQLPLSAIAAIVIVPALIVAAVVIAT